MKRNTGSHVEDMTMRNTVGHALRQALQGLEAERRQLDQAITNIKAVVREAPQETQRQLTVLDGGAKRRPMTPARRKAVSAWMKKYWAKRKKLEAKRAA